MPREKRDRIERLDEVWGFLDQRNISVKNIKRLKTLISHPDAEVQSLAKLVLDVALVRPFKRRRWQHLAARHRDLFHRAVAVLGIDFFYEVLMDYGDTGGPLWDALEESGKHHPGQPPHVNAAAVSPSATVAWNVRMPGPTKLPPAPNELAQACSALRPG